VKVRNAKDASDAELLRKVRTLVEESERRQKNELALRLGEIVQEFDAKRGADRAAIRALRAIQNGNGIDVMRHEQWLDMLTQVSMQK
jgi:hypothetical protein